MTYGRLNVVLMALLFLINCSSIQGQYNFPDGTLGFQTIIPANSVNLTVSKPSFKVLRSKVILDKSEAEKTSPVSLRFNKDATYLVTGTTDGAITLWNIKENLEDGTQSPIFFSSEDILIGKKEEYPFFLPSKTYVDIHPLGPKTGYIAAIGKDRYRSENNLDPVTGRLLIDLKNNHQNFSNDGSALVFLDVVKEGLCGMAFSPSGNMEAFFDSDHVLVTSKLASGKDNDGLHEIVFNLESPNIKAIAWQNENLVVLDDKRIISYNVWNREKLLYHQSNNAHGISFQGDLLLSFGEQHHGRSDFVRIFDTKNLTELSFSLNKDSPALIAAMPKPSTDEIAKNCPPKIFAVGFQNGEIMLCEIETQKILWTGKLLGGEICTIDFVQTSQKELLLAAGNSKGFLALFKVILN